MPDYDRLEDHADWLPECADRDAPFLEGCFPPRLPFVGTAGGVPLEAAAT